MKLVTLSRWPMPPVLAVRQTDGDGTTGQYYSALSGSPGIRVRHWDSWRGALPMPIPLDITEGYSVAFAAFATQAGQTSFGWELMGWPRFSESSGKNPLGYLLGFGTLSFAAGNNYTSKHPLTGVAGGKNWYPAYNVIEEVALGFVTINIHSTTDVDRPALIELVDTKFFSRLIFRVFGPALPTGEEVIALAYRY